MATALIEERGTVSGNQFRMSRLIEDANQTFLAGTPVELNPANGGVRAWDGTTIDEGILGIAKEFGAGLPIAGVPLGVPSPPAVAGVIPMEGGGKTFGSVPNMPGARNLLRPYFNDGRTGVVLAIQDTMFFGQVGPTQAAPTLADIGKIFGLTKDTDGHWYLDRTKTTEGTNAVARIVGLDNWDTKRGLLFVFNHDVGKLPA